MPNATVAKLCSTNSTPPVASSWLIGGAESRGAITSRCSSAPSAATSRMAKRRGDAIGQPEDLDQVVHAVHADHHQLGVADPGHVDDAEDQVQPERQQRQHAAEQDAVDHRFEQVDVEDLGHRFHAHNSPR